MLVFPKSSHRWEKKKGNRKKKNGRAYDMLITIHTKHTHIKRLYPIHKALTYVGKSTIKTHTHMKEKKIQSK